MDDARNGRTGGGDIAAPAATRSEHAVPDDFFRLVVDRTAVPFVAITPAGDICYASSSITGLVGWTADELVGSSIFDFIDEEQAAVAARGLTEALEHAAPDAGVPVVMPVRDPAGEQRWLEIAAMRFDDGPQPGLIALRIRSWEAQRHLNDFLRLLLTDAPLEELLRTLTCSIAASVEAVRAAVHHGFDGERFLGVTGSWDAASELPLDGGAWVERLPAPGEIVVHPADEVTISDAPQRFCWMVGVGGSTVAPAVVTVWTALEGPPLLGHRAALLAAADHVQLALVRTAEHQRLLHVAGHDSLTGVANRGAFRDRLAQALANGERELAVAFCDLDGFKEVNDQHGHIVGDGILIRVAERLGAALRVGDELARIGGDEFTVLWREIPDEGAVDQVAERLLAAMVEPFEVPGGTVQVGLSIGVAMSTPGATADALLASADAALYRSKRGGGGAMTVAR